jgi:hypothetical protein
VHPFFDCGTFPWHLPEAAVLHRVLCQQIREPNAAVLFCQNCGFGNPEDISENQSIKLVWRQLLDAMAAATLLRALDRLARADIGLVQVHRALDALAAMEPPAVRRRLSSNVIFLDRVNLRDCLTRLAAPGDRGVLLVRGPKHSGKSWTRHLITEYATLFGEKVIVIVPGLVATSKELLNSLFVNLLEQKKVPSQLTSDPAWYRLAYTYMARDAAVRNKHRRYWIVVDDLQEMDREIREFFDQATLQMVDPSFSKWFRVVLIDYPAQIPTKWDGSHWIDDEPKPAEIDETVLSAFLVQAAQQRNKTLTEADSVRWANEILTRSAAPRDGQDRRCLLQRINEELTAEMAKL